MILNRYLNNTRECSNFLIFFSLKEKREKNQGSINRLRA